jgi:hypothetical protein
MTDDDSISALQEQARRCRRLAATLVDADMRQALQDLAEEYDARAGKAAEAGGGTFMLNSDRGRDRYGQSRD